MHEPWDLSDPQERDLAAGEYVLGTLDSRQRANFEALLAVSPDLRRQVARWREHLQVFNDQLDPVPPPETLWPRIARTLGLSDTPWRRRLGVWRGLTAAFALMALVLAGFLYLRPAPGMIPGDAVFVVLDDDQVPGWIISASESGELMVQAVQPAMPSGMAGELWLMKDGEPVSLGMLPDRGEARMEMPRELRSLMRHADLAVSIEPAGGAPQGKPTGPVIDHGRLIPMRGDDKVRL
ncbi:anti-sigma factor [Modicisalibacter coralii]|uniref:anti-sigma factor n=1 Tax=Modicisalibacter coralii TaxID=2304602 RepID=UPI00100B90D6|nr:anti-sigma factor [Halomonas coralii]